MINNRLKILNEEEIYDEINIMMKGSDEKHIYIDGKTIFTLNDFLKVLNYPKEYERDRFNYDAISDVLTDIFNYDNKERKIIIIISNLNEILANLKYTGLTKKKFIMLLNDNNKYFENGSTVFSSGYENRKSIDVYLSNDDINFERLKETVNDREDNEEIIEQLNTNKVLGIYPIGTVVRLKDETRNDKLSKYKYMITSRFVLQNKRAREYYEYKANIYPLGTLSSNKGKVFNNEDVGSVEFVGYEDESNKVMIKKTLEKIEEKGLKKAQKLKKQKMSNKIKNFLRIK